MKDDRIALILSAGGMVEPFLIAAITAIVGGDSADTAYAMTIGFILANICGAVAFIRCELLRKRRENLLEVYSHIEEESIVNDTIEDTMVNTVPVILSAIDMIPIYLCVIVNGLITILA